MPFLYAMEKSNVAPQSITPEWLVRYNDTRTMPRDIKREITDFIMCQHEVIPLLLKNVFVNRVREWPCIKSYCIDQQGELFASSVKLNQIYGSSTAVWIDDIAHMQQPLGFTIGHGIECLAFTTDKLHLVCALSTGDLLLWNMQKWSTSKQVPIKMSIEQLEIIDDEHAVVCGQSLTSANDALVRIIALSDGSIKKEWKMDANQGQFFISCVDTRCVVQKRDHGTFSLVAVPQTSTEIFDCVEMKSDAIYSKELVVIPHGAKKSTDIRVGYCYADSQINVYDGANAVKKTFYIDADVASIHATPELLVTIKELNGMNHQIALWDLSTGFKLRQWFVRGGSTRAAISKNNRYLSVYTDASWTRAVVYDLEEFTTSLRYLKTKLNFGQALFLQSLYPSLKNNDLKVPRRACQEYHLDADSKEKDIINSFGDLTIKLLIERLVHIKQPEIGTLEKTQSFEYFESKAKKQKKE